MKKQQNHIIEHQVINLTIIGVDSDLEIQKIQSQVIQQVQTEINDVFEKSFSKIIPDDVEIQLDHLNISTTAITFRNEKELKQKILELVVKETEKELKKKLDLFKKQRASKQKGNRGFSRFHILKFFIESGQFPSWASPKNGSIIELFDYYIQNDPMLLLSNLQLWVKNKKFEKRLLYQLQSQQFQQLTTLVAGANSNKLEQQVAYLKGKYIKQHKIIHFATLKYLLDNKGKKITSPIAFRDFVVDEIQKSQFRDKGSKHIQEAFVRQHSDLDLLDYFLKFGAIPHWGSVGNKIDLNDLLDGLLSSNLIKTQKRIQANFQNEAYLKRLSTQFDFNTVLKIFEPLPNKYIGLIKDCVEGFEFLSQKRTTINSKLSKNNISTAVLSSAISFFLNNSRTRYSGKSFVDHLLADFSSFAKTGKEIILKEAYRFNRRKEGMSLNPIFESLDDQLKRKLEKDRKAFLALKREQLLLSRKLDKLRKNAAGSTDFIKTQKELLQIEKDMIAVSDEDVPLEIELVAEYSRALKEQLLAAEGESVLKIQEKIAFATEEYDKLQENIEKEISKLLKYQSKQDQNLGTIPKQKIKDADRKLDKYNKTLQHLVNLFTDDRNNIISFLNDIRTSLRSSLSFEEKKALKTKRKALEEALKKLDKNLILLVKQSSRIDQNRKDVQSAENEDPLGKHSNNSMLDAFEFVLQYGATPWWAEAFEVTDLDNLVQKLLVQSPNALHKVLRRVGRYPAVWSRLSAQLKDKTLRQLTEELLPEKSTLIQQIGDLFSSLHYAQGFDHLKNVGRNTFKWSALLEAAFAQNKNLLKTSVVESARLFRLNPYTLLEYLNNIASNQSTKFNTLTNDLRALEKSTEVSNLDLEQKEAALKQINADLGLDLNKDQKLSLLLDFLATGQVNDLSKKLHYDRSERFESLFLEQIHDNKPNLKDRLSGVLNNTSTRTHFIKHFSENAFWELVFLLKPSALLPAQRSFTDLKQLTEDKNMSAEKEVLLMYLYNNPSSKYDNASFLRTLISIKQVNSGRNGLAILLDLKQQLYKKKKNSSTLLQLILFEMDLLKQQQKQSTDINLNKNLQTQILSLTDEYTKASKNLSEILSIENAETVALPSYLMDNAEIVEEINQLNAELKALKSDKRKDALSKIEVNRRMENLKAKIQLLEKLRSPLIRQKEKEISFLKDKIKQLKKDLKDVVLFNEKDTSLDLQKTSSSVLELLLSGADPIGLNAGFEDFSFFTEEDLSGLGEAFKKAPSIDHLAKHIKAPELKSLLDNLNKLAPNKLWELFQNMDLSKVKNDQILMIRKTLLSRDQKNFYQLMQLMLKEQQTLNKGLDKLKDDKGIQEAYTQLRKLKKKQLASVKQYESRCIDPAFKTAVQKLKRNFEIYFNNMQITIKRYEYSIYNKNIETKQSTLNLSEINLEKEEKLLDYLVSKAKKEKQSLKEPQKEVQKRKKPPKKKSEEIREPLLIKNAGLVLLWPYFSRLFATLKYTENNKFINEESQHKAIHLLQYIANGNTSAPENELLLNKVFCAYPITEPIPYSMDFSEHELKVAESLMMGAIKNWPKMNTLTPASLRGTFLNREGTLMEEEDKWIVTVKKQTYDVLLKSVPWNFTFINLSWMPKSISVEWKLI